VLVVLVYCNLISLNYESFKVLGLFQLDNYFFEFIKYYSTGVIISIFTTATILFIEYIMPDKNIDTINSINENIYNEKLYFNYKKLELFDIETNEIIAYNPGFEKEQREDFSNLLFFGSIISVLSWIGLLILILGLLPELKRFSSKRNLKNLRHIKIEKIKSKSLSKKEKVQLLIECYNLQKSI
jgi:hypothetical protein